MAKIEIRNFLGEMPRAAPFLLADNASQFAETCDLISGEIQTWKGLSPAEELNETEEVIHLHRFMDSIWLYWSEDVDTEKVAIPNDETERTVITGLDFPRIFDSTMVDVGLPGGDLPEETFRLGIPAPDNAPGVLVLGTGGGDPTETTTYVYTYVRTWSTGTTDEGPPSPASETVDVEVDQYVRVSGFDTIDAAEYGITHIRIYRAVTAAGETSFQFVDEIDYGTDPYDDTKAIADLGETLQSTYYDPPPPDLQGITELENGILAGFRQNEVCFCEPYQFHAWPVAYRSAIAHNIKAIATIGGTLVVGTTDHPYLITGIDPAAMSQIQLPGRYPCLSKRGMISSAAGVFFPSSDGLVMVSPSAGAKIVTKTLMAKEDWESIYPDSIHAYYYSNRYFGFYRSEDKTVSGGFIINFDAGDYTRLPYYATAGVVCGCSGALFLVLKEGNRNVLRQWNAGGVPLFYTWKSKSYIVPPMNLSVAKLRSRQATKFDSDYADAAIQRNQDKIDAGLAGCGNIAGSATATLAVAKTCLEDVPSENQRDTLWFRMFVDEVLKYSKLVESDDAFRLPGGYLGEKFSFEVSGNRNVISITAATNMQELNYDA
jgi:hypothetical protein